MEDKLIRVAITHGDTNDKLEFCYQAKVRNEETGKLGNVFVIADEDGNTIRTFASSDKGVATTVGCYNATATRKEFYVQYNDETSNKYYLEFFLLPFEKYHNGGDGTKQNPYLVATAGDLIAMKDNPKAFYKMVNDINLTNFNIVNDTWTPIDAFAGNFDGTAPCYYISTFVCDCYDCIIESRVNVCTSSRNILFNTSFTCLLYFCHSLLSFPTTSSC